MQISVISNLSSVTKYVCSKTFKCLRHKDLNISNSVVDTHLIHNSAFVTYIYYICQSVNYRFVICFFFCCFFYILTPSLCLCLFRVGQPRGQSDRHLCSGAPPTWEEQADVGAADEPSGQVGGDKTEAELNSAVLNLISHHAASVVMRIRVLCSPVILPH